MSEKMRTESKNTFFISILKKFQIENTKIGLQTILNIILGVGVYLLLASIPMPYTMVGLFKFGITPAVAVIAVVGVFRGPFAGFFTGYFGTLLYDLFSYSTIMSMTLPYLAYGLIGFITGLAKYNPTNGRSLIKISIISSISFIITILLIALIGLTLEKVDLLFEIGFVILPLVTVGIPSIFLLTPLYARVWHYFITKINSDE